MWRNGFVRERRGIPTMLDFQIKHSRRKRENAYGICCDGFLSQSIINGFGFTNTKFVLDYWHLFKQVSTKLWNCMYEYFSVAIDTNSFCWCEWMQSLQILPKKFSNRFYIIENELRHMVNAPSETICHRGRFIVETKSESFSFTYQWSEGIVLWESKFRIVQC